MSKSVYAQKMARLASRIFGDVARKTDSKSMKVVRIFSEKPVYERPDVVNYYVENEWEMNRLFIKLRFNGLFIDEHAEFKEMVKAERDKLGKPTKPKKGKGKRASKK